MVQAAEIGLHVADITGDGFSVSDIEVKVADVGGELNIGQFRVGGQVWADLHLHCRDLQFGIGEISCRKGSLGAESDGVPLAVRYQLQTHHLEIRIGEHERSVISADLGEALWSVSGSLQQFRAAWLAKLLPAGSALPSAGELTGNLALRGDGLGVRSASVQLRLDRGAFSDAEGLHAAEGLGGKLELAAIRRGTELNWNVSGDWRAGELFWQPLYLRSGYHLQAEGRLAGERVIVSRMTLQHAGVGEIRAQFEWAQGLREAHVQGTELQLAALFGDWVKPLLPQASWSQASLAGIADIDWQYRDAHTQSLMLRLQQVDMQDGEGRFALRGVSGTIPWQKAVATEAALSFTGGELLHIPLGKAAIHLQMRDLAFSAPEVTVPIWDGRLTLRDLHVHQENGDWHASLAGNLTPVSMLALSRSFGWPEMSGTLSGMIPQVSYSDGKIHMDGALLFQVFDGTVVASHLALEDAFGLAPRFSGDLDMRELDLDMLTHTFSFGSMQGRLDVGVHGLKLENWQPVSFDARVASSPGSYKRKISQRAVENITSLGGGGATAAMQRWYLQIFKEFGYDRIGLSCVLRNGVCRMEGVEPAGSGYVIIKGGGVPAINVIGYNRSVGWDELLSRLKRVLDSNAHPVIK